MRHGISTAVWIMAGVLASSTGGGLAKAQEALIAADVAVVGGTPGGIAAAVGAARLGNTVILCEPTAHVGGIVASGLTNVDLIKVNAVGGVFREFAGRVRGHYRDAYGEKSPQYKECRNGFHFEPKIAKAKFLELLDEQKPRVRVLYRHRLVGAKVEQNRVIAAEFEDQAGSKKLTIAAKVFIDATYEGDLSAMAGVAYRVGRESRGEFNEKHAGVIYARFGKDEFQPGSTGEGDAGIQAFCFRFMLTKIPQNRAPVRKPEGYNSEDYKHLLADITAGKIKHMKPAIQMWPLPNDKFEINSENPHPDTGVPSESLDLAEENWGWPEASYTQRAKLLQRIWSYNEGLIWFLQNDPRVPQALREEASQFGFCKDEFTDNDNRPWQVYVRQGRRIMGEYRLTENDGNTDPQTRRTKIQPTSIAIAEYPFDSHGVHKYDPNHPGVREGYIYIRHDPIQLPYGIIVPQKIDGLLVPVACSATHVGYQTIRMEPVFMALGQAAGTAASVSIAQGTSVRGVAIDRVQKIIVGQGAVITYCEDLKFDDPAFAAIQFMGARGAHLGYKVEPERTLTKAAGRRVLQRVFDVCGIRVALPEETSEELMTRPDVAAMLQRSGLKLPAGWEGKGAMRFRDFVEGVYGAMTSAN